MLKNSGKNLGFNGKLIHFILFVCLLFMAPVAFAQIDIQRYTTATDTFYWKRYIHIPKPPRVSLKRFSVSGASKKVDSFLAHNLSQFPQFMNDSGPVPDTRELKKCLYPVDINADKLADMIFSGTIGGETEMVRIWLNRRDTFELIFEDYQYLSGFTKTENKLGSMQTGDTGDSGDYLYFTRDYRVVQEKGLPEFVKGKQVVAYKYTEEPVKYYPSAIPFSARADTLLLRASAAMQNEPFIPSLDSFGNIIAKYRTKIRGIVLAYKSNAKGNDWFFVEISPADAPSASILYGIDKIPTYIRGWVSSQSIQLEPR
jgi:hypothetical protein